MNDPWRSAEFGPLSSIPTSAMPTYPAITHGLDGPEYQRQYNHGSHAGDAVGVFRSDCPGCQRHLSEAFGPVLQKVIAIHRENRLELSAEDRQNEARLVIHAELAISADNLYAAVGYLLAALELDPGPVS